MTPPVVTAFYAGLNALFFIWLTVRVIGYRRAGIASIGDGGHEGLARSIRAHGNAAEFMPIALILLALSEIFGAPGAALHLAGAGLTAGRAMHGLRFNGVGPAWFRFAGMALTLAVTGLLALGLVGHSLLGML